MSGKASGEYFLDPPSPVNAGMAAAAALHQYIDMESYDVVSGETHRAAMDCMNYAWTIICNVSEGDWTKQSQEWQDAAARCRDEYHALLDLHSTPGMETE